MEYRTDKRYAFRLKVGNAQSVECHPSYKDVVVSHTKRDDEMYYEQAFDGEFTFVGEDYERIANADITTKFELYVYRAESPNAEYVKGVFWKSDGKTDNNRKTFKVKPALNDMYKALVYGKADERNLTNLKPKQGKMTFNIDPVLQLYRLGESTMYQVTSSGHVTKREVAQETDIDLMRNTYHWGVEDHYFAYVASGNAAGVYAYGGAMTRKHVGNIIYYSTRLIGYSITERVSGETIHVRNGYDISINFRIGTSLASYDISSITIYDNAHGTIYAQTSLVDDISVNTKMDVDVPIMPMGSGNVRLSLRRETILTRPVYGLGPGSSSLGNEEIDPMDPMVVGGVLKYTVSNPFPVQLWQLVNEEIAVTEDENEGIRLVKNNETYYYAMCDDFMQGNVSIYDSAWGELFSAPSADYSSMAYQIGVSKTWKRTLQNQGFFNVRSYQKTNNDWYLLTSVIQKLAHACDSTIHFEDNRAVGGVCDSRFLFGDYSSATPFARTNPLNGDAWGRLMILQKSNILQLNYDAEATNAKITLEQVFTLLKNAFNCWYELYIWHNPTTGKDEKHLRIEHIWYYLNGHSYDASGRQVKDINAISDVRNGKPLSYLSDNWTYDEDRCANRYEFGWMDEQSEFFDGYQMKVPSEFNIWGNSKTEERPIDWFSSDIDYLMANAEQCAYDGFVVAQTSLWGNSMINTYTYTDPTSGENHTLQNGQLAMVYLQPKWMCYDIYSPKIRINNEDAPYTDVVVTSKLRQNTLKFRLADGQVLNPEDVLLCEVRNGNVAAQGHIESIKHDLSSDWIEAVVNYDCEVPNGYQPGGSRVVVNVVTDYDDNEVMGFIGGRDEGFATIEQTIDRFGNNVTGHISTMESENKLVVSGDVVSVNESQWGYSKEAVIAYLQGDGDKTNDGMVSAFGDGILNYMDYLLKEGSASTDGEQWWASWTTEEMLGYLADVETETSAKMSDMFGPRAVGTLESLSPMNYCWPIEEGVWKTSYLGVEYGSEVIDVTLNLLAETGGADLTTIANDVVGGNMKVENLLDCMIYNGLIIKEEEQYKLA